MRGQKTYYVYIGDHPKTGVPFYVGKGVHVGLGGCARFSRHNFHLRRGDHCNRRMQRAFDKYGPISWTVIRANISESEAFETEHALIMYWGRSEKDLLCNMTDGGEGGSGYRHSEASLAKMRSVRLGYKASAETRAKIGAASKFLAQSPPRRAKMLASIQDPKARSKAAESRRGRTMPDEQRAKIGAGNRGKIATPETRAKLAAAKIGKRRRPPSAETRAKMSAAQKGKTGRPQSPEIREKISRTLKATLSSRPLSVRCQILVGRASLTA